MAKFKGSKKTSSKILEQTKSDYKVRFSFKDCFLKKGFCITELEPKEVTKFFGKIGENENLTIHEFCTKRKTSGGFSIYKSSSTSHKRLKAMFTKYDSFGHFWILGVETKHTFRIMGSRRDDTIYILLIDYDGKVDDAAHK